MGVGGGMVAAGVEAGGAVGGAPALGVEVLPEEARLLSRHQTLKNNINIKTNRVQ